MINKMLEELLQHSRNETLLRRLQPKSKGEPTFSRTGYDNHTSYVTDSAIRNMLDIAYEINLDGTYKNDATGEEFVTRGGGTGFVAYSTADLELLVTCEHVMDGLPEQIRNYITGETFTLQEVQPFIVVGDERTPIETLRMNPETDIAIIKPIKRLNLQKKVAFANKPLAVGDAVYAVGYPSLIGKFLSQGIITNLGGDDDYFFYESAPLNPGNCLVSDTLISTSEGPKKIIDIKEGDAVFS